MEQDIINSLIIELQAKNEQIKFLQELVKNLTQKSETAVETN